MATQVTIDQPTQAPGAPMDIHGLGRFLNGEARKVTEEQITHFMENLVDYKSVRDEVSGVVHSQIIPRFESFEDAVKSIHGDTKVEEVPDDKEVTE